MFNADPSFPNVPTLITEQIQKVPTFFLHSFLCFINVIILLGFNLLDYFGSTFVLGFHKNVTFQCCPLSLSNSCLVHGTECACGSTLCFSLCLKLFIWFSAFVNFFAFLELNERENVNCMCFLHKKMMVQNISNFTVTG